MQKLNQTIAKQKGAVLILMAFIIGLGVLAYLLQAFDPARIKLEQDEKTVQTLNEAKQALIAWSVSHPNTPGQMPWPDRKENVNPNYDGSSDCVNGVYQPSYLIGQLPSLPTTSPCIDPNNGLFVYAGLSTYPGLGQEFKDAQGNRLWYSVSRNLVYDYEQTENPIVNPGMISSTIGFAPYLRQGGTKAYDWLRVLDRNANLVSDRVAAVIMAPGNPIGGQDRSGVAEPNQFLDSFQIGAATYNNSSYTNVAEDFVMGEDSRNVSANDPTFVKPYNFNDKLVYITIDELMAAIEKRVGEEVRANLRSYAASNTGNYPFAAVLGGVGSTRKYRCTDNMLRGALPVDNPANTCTYTSSPTTVNSTCNFQDITSVAFRKSTAGNFTAASQACNFATTTCTCTGAGSCSTGTTVFSCNAAGSCSANVAGRIRFFGAGLDTSSSSAICTLGTLSTCVSPANTISRTVTCNGPSTTVSLGYSCAESLSTLPAWFNANRWQDYVFYEMTRPANVAGIIVGNRATGAMVTTTGRPINTAPFSFKGSAQAKPSCDVRDYLDSQENVDVDNLIAPFPPNRYEPTSTLRTNNYNDQTFVVGP